MQEIYQRRYLAGWCRMATLEIKEQELDFIKQYNLQIFGFKKVKEVNFKIIFFDNCYHFRLNPNFPWKMLINF